MLLATKYRPQVFSDTLGQDTARLLLQGILRLRSTRPIPMPLIFEGVYGSGKTSFARLFAQALLCSQRGLEPCNACPACQDVIRGIHPGFRELAAAGCSEVEDVERVRQQLGSQGSGLQVVLWDEAHLLSEKAQAALLDVFETPPANTVFMLVTSDLTRMLRTIQSRGFILEFRALPREQIKRRVVEICEKESIPFEETAMDRIIIFSKGHLRDALMYVDKAVIAGGVTEDIVRKVVPVDLQSDVLRILYSVVTGDYVGLTGRLERVFEKTGVRLVSAEFFELLKNLLLQKYAESPTLYGESAELGKDIIRRLDSKLERFIKEALGMRLHLEVSEQSFYVGCFYLTSLFTVSATPHISELQRLRARSIKSNPVEDLLKIPGVSAG